MINELEKKILKGGYKRLVNVIENILLRPNDNMKLMGKDKYNNYVKAAEKVLNERYKGSKLYSYYYDLPKQDHGFCSFERWKLGLLF